MRCFCHPAIPVIGGVDLAEGNIPGMMQEGQQGNEAFCEVGRGLIPGVTDRLPECTPRRLKDGGEAMTQSLRSGPSVDIGARHINPARRWAVHLNTGNLVFVNTNQLVPD